MALRPLAWFDVMDAGTLDIQSGLITTMRDKSGNGNHATAAGTLRPTYNLRGFNGELPAAVFDGVDDSMTHPAPATAQPVTIALAAHSIGVGNGSNAIVYQNANYDLQMVNSFGGNWRMWGGTANLFSGVADTGKVSWISCFNGASSYLAATGTKYNAGSDLGTGQLTTTMYLGSEPGANWANFNFGELIVIPRAIGDAERNMIEGYFARKWGFSSRLPQSHPFCNGKP